MSRSFRRLLVPSLLAIAAAWVVYACASRQSTSSLVGNDAAQRTYVAPGQYDEFVPL